MARSENGYAFVTVGTTQFDAMVTAVFKDDVLKSLSALGIPRLIVQLGRGKLPTWLLDQIGQHATDKLESPGAVITTRLVGIDMEIYRMKASIADDISGAVLVISHAGAGSIFETIRAKKPLIVVTNTLLADNHQVELAAAMHSRGHLLYAEPSQLAEILRRDGSAMVRPGGLLPLPKIDRIAFVGALDCAMGFEQ